MLRPAISLLLLLTALTGGLYPLAVTGGAMVIAPDRARGSLIEARGRVVGSELVGQSFVDPRYFWGRPSATSARPYDGAASSGSNLGPSSPALREAIAERKERLAGGAAAIPVDLLTASGSGLDPHVSPEAAYYQVPRVARERGLPEARVRALVEAAVEGRTLGLLGEPRVNVLLLNLRLDALAAEGA